MKCGVCFSQICGDFFYNAFLATGWSNFLEQTLQDKIAPWADINVLVSCLSSFMNFFLHCRPYLSFIIFQFHYFFLLFFSFSKPPSLAPLLIQESTNTPLIEAPLPPPDSTSALPHYHVLVNTSISTEKRHP